MTIDELREHFNNKFGMKPWPKFHEVDHETYANCCQYIFTKKAENEGQLVGEYTIIPISVGLNNGLMFKNVELILVNKMTGVIREIK